MGALDSIFSALPFLLQTAPAIKTGLQGKNLKAQKAAAAQMGPLAAMQAQLAGAQSNTNSPLFQQLFGQEKEAGNQNLAATISQIQAQNRMAQSRGQKPLLDQERGGESIFRNLIQGQQDVGNQALQNTFGQLKSAQNAYSGAEQGYNSIYNTQNNIANEDYSNNLKQVGGYYSLGDTLKGLFGLNQGQGTQGYQNPGAINWNQSGPSTPTGWSSYR